MEFTLEGSNTAPGAKSIKEVQQKNSQSKGVYVVNYRHVSRVGDETFRQRYFWKKEDAIRSMREEWGQKKYAFNWPDTCDVTADSYEYFDKSFVINVTDAEIRFEKSHYKWDVEFCEVR